MFITKIFIERPRMLIMIVLALAIFGVISYMGLPVTLMPDVELPFVTVQTVYPGAGPSEIETLISRPIEDAVSNIGGVRQMMSYSLDNVSFVLLEFEDHVQPEFAKLDVKDNIDAIIAQLPTDAHAPVVQTFDIGASNILELVLVGTQDNRELNDYVERYMQDRILQQSGVAQIQVSGGQRREIHIKFKRQTLQNYGLSLMQMMGMIAQQNINMPGGYIQRAGSEYTIRLDGEFSSIEEIENLEIPTPFGNKKLLDLAVIDDTQADVREISKYYNKELGDLVDLNVITIGIQKTTDANEVETADLVKREVDALRDELPAGMALFVADDYSLYTRGAKADTINSIILGIIFTAFVLLVFLHDIRSTIIVSLSMPVAIITTFIFIQISGFSLNMLSLMGLSVAVGILVANSIVVIENIYRHAVDGAKMKDAALTGTSEIAIAVAATTLTNVVVFLPIANMSGIIGGFFRQFGLTVTYATILSLLVAFTLTPMLAALMLKSDKIRKMVDPANLSGASRFIETAVKRLEAWYKRLLSGIVGKKGKEVAFMVFTVIALFASFMIVPIIGGEFMPFADSGDLTISLDMPTFYDLSRTYAVVETIEERLKEHGEVETITSTVGTRGGIDVGQNIARLNVLLVPPSQRSISTRQFAARMRRELADIPDAELSIFARSRIGAGGDGTPIQLYVVGQEQELVVKYATRLMELAEEVPNAVNISSNYDPGKPEIRLVPNRTRMADMGVNTAMMAMELRAAIDGVISTKYREMGYEYDVKLRLDEDDRSSPEMIGQVPIATPKGIVPLEQLADVEYTESVARIFRIDKFNAVTVSMGADGRTPQEVLNDVMAKVDELNMPGGYSVKIGGEAEIMQDSFRSMFQALILAIILTYMLLVSILESFMQPFIIFFTIPLSLIGVLLALLFTGGSLNMISLMSFIMLVGIVVNNAILLIDYTNILRNKGQETKDAIVNACPIKLRPILMSTLAIILGMLPLAMGIGSEGVEIRQQMGLVTIAGLIVSSIFTMLVIPILYRWFSPKLTH